MRGRKKGNEFVKWKYWTKLNDNFSLKSQRLCKEDCESIAVQLTGQSVEHRSTKLEVKYLNANRCRISLCSHKVIDLKNSHS